MKVEQMWTASCRELDAVMNFTSCKWRGKEWDSEEVESHFIENNEDNGFQILKTTREHLYFGSFSSWRHLEGMDVFTNKFLTVLIGIDEAWDLHSVSKIHLFFYSALCIKKSPISHTR